MARPAITTIDRCTPAQLQALLALAAGQPDSGRSLLAYIVNYDELQRLLKVALGVHSSADEEQAKNMVTQAVTLSRQAGSLMEAADLLEEALNKWPDLRERYEYQLKLWRRGVVM